MASGCTCNAWRRLGCAGAPAWLARRLQTRPIDTPKPARQRISRFFTAVEFRVFSILYLVYTGVLITRWLQAWLQRRDFDAVSAIDLIVLWVALELMNLPLYALAGSDRNHLRSTEAGLKAFLTGAFSSAILLYGMALLYGATGSTSFEAIRVGFDPYNNMGLIGLGLIVVGFAPAPARGC